MSVFIFRRDIRLTDNNGLYEALNKYGNVFCFFVFDRKQIDKNNYFSCNSFQFLLEGLLEVKRQLQSYGSDLITILASNNELIEILIKINLPVFWNKDYTHFARKRDERLKTVLERQNIQVTEVDDYTLFNHDLIKSKKGTFYKVFKYYYNGVIDLLEQSSENWYPKVFDAKYKKQFGNFEADVINDYYVDLENYYRIYPKNENLIVNGNRQLALNKLYNIRNFQNYAQTRDIPFYKIWSSKYQRNSIFNTKTIWYQF